MKNSFYFCIFIIAFLLNSCKTDSNSNNESDNDTIIENQLFGNYIIPSELEYSNHAKEDFYYNKFYPIGWSEDGLFAYISEDADEGSGYYFFKIIIQNLINDKIEWEWEPVYSESGDINSIWTENYTMIENKLKEYKIIQTKNFSLGKTNFTNSGKQFNIKLNNKTSTNQEYGFDVINSTEVILSSPQLGYKIIYQNKEDDYSLLLGQIVAGYLLSPHEERIAVIIKNERTGYEGPPNVIYYTITGSNLTESFQPETIK